VTDELIKMVQYTIKVMVDGRQVEVVVDVVVTCHGAGGCSSSLC
jgi:hypothetical protein